MKQVSLDKELAEARRKKHSGGQRHLWREKRPDSPSSSSSSSGSSYSGSESEDDEDKLRYENEVPQLKINGVMEKRVSREEVQRDKADPFSREQQASGAHTPIFEGVKAPQLGQGRRAEALTCQC